MASTFSPNLRLELIGTGEQQGTWGATTNVNLGTLLEEAIGGYTSVTVSNSGDTTLTTNNGSADQSRNMVLNLTGTISAARNVIVPAIEKLYVVKNATTGGFAVTLKVSGQTGVSVPNGSTLFLYVDGTDVRAITGSAALQSIGTSGATVPLLNGTNTWSSSQTFTNTNNTFGNGSGEANIIVNGAAGVGRNVIYQTNGSNRWATSASTGAETGSNAGSDYAIARYTDAGAYIDTVLVINRASGVTSLKELSLTTDLAVSHGGTGASDAATARTNLGLGTAATQNTGTSGANIPLLNAINTWSGAQSFTASANAFGPGTGEASIRVTGGAGSGRWTIYRSSSSNRWTLGANGTAETGSNVGSDFDIYRYDDSGAVIDTVLSISRSTGLTTIKELGLTTDLAIAHGGTGASDAATARTNLGLGTAATQNTGTSGANVPLLNGANTWSSSQTFSAGGTFGSGSGNIYVNLNGGAGAERYNQFRTGTSARWSAGANSGAESGANAGSDYVINRFSDAGAYIDTPFVITRSNGITTLKELNLTTTLAVTQGGTGTTTATGTGSVVRAASPALSGTPTAPTAAAYTNTTQVATTAQVYATVTNVPINYQTGTSYTLASSDCGKMVQLNNGSAITLTVPSGVFSAGDRIDITQLAGGQVTISAGAGMTLFSSGSKTKLSGQFSAATLHFWDGSRAQIIGDLA